MIAEHTLMCYIIAAHKGQSEVPVITDKVQVSIPSTDSPSYRSFHMNSFRLRISC